MSNSRMNNYVRISATITLAILICLSAAGWHVLPELFGLASAQSANGQQPEQIVVIAPGSAYRQANLVSDSPGVAFVQDPLLVNPWGIAFRGTSPFWVANNGTSTSTLYRGDVSGSPVVKNPGLAGITIPGGLPTGVVGNSTSDFVVTSGMASGAANFIFSSITGNISGWNANVPAPGSTTAVIMASHPGHVYTGLALANNGGGNFLYAADFANGTIDVFNSTYSLQPAASFPFQDPTIPTTPGNTFHPFNIQNIGGSLYVTYAKVGPDGLDEEGVGNGFVRRFNTNGVRDLTFGINNGALNSPWGLAIAPASFGIFGGALLVGNFGEGNPSIHAYNPTTGAFLGTLQDESGNGIVIEELWGLIFGNGVNGGDVNTLYFAAGIGDEEHGLFGSLKPTTASATNLVQLADSEFAISEAGAHIDVTVVRLGDVSGTSTVRYATFDESQPGHASQKNDYEIAVGILQFAPGETSKTFRVLIVNDESVEGNEVIDVILSNPTGVGTGIGTPNVGEIVIVDNDVAPPLSNPIDNTNFFVRQLYLDLLNREPDAGSLAFATQILNCGGDQSCIYKARAEVASTFFKSTEYQDTAFLDYLTNVAAFGTTPLYGQSQFGTQSLQRGLQPGPDFATQLEANKVAYYNEFVTRSEFVARYPSTLTNTQYVDNLLATAALSPSQVRLFVVNMTNGQEVPPTNPTTTTGAARPASSGTARLQFNAAQTALTLNATVDNIDFTGSQTSDTNDNLTNAHIHAGAAVTPGVNGPVVWGFIGTPFNDNNPNDAVVTPKSVGVGGTVSAKWDAPEGNGTTLAAQLSNLREGRAYVNFHTVQFGGGEIRGNIPAADSLRNTLIAGLNGGTLTRATVLRRIAEQEELRTREFNNAVANLSIFAFWRRDADTVALNKLVTRLNSFSGDVIREAVRLLITSPEYRQRFGADGLFLTNTAPDANNDAAATTGNTPIVIAVLANDTDFEGNNLSVTNVVPGVGGSVSTNGTTVTFTPNANFVGVANFTYTITDDGTLALDSGGGPLNDPKSDSATVSVTVSGASLQFTASAVAVNEGAGSITIDVTRSGDTGVAATVDYATNDFLAANCSTVNGSASSRCDYATAGGRLRFAAGETTKQVVLSIVNDVFVEGNETFTLTLSNPSSGSAVNPPSVITITITDNDSDPAAPNPFPNNSFFVRQQYLDFLLREPDNAGFTTWLNVLNNCAPNQGFLGSNPACDRVHVSSSFFRSTEFGETGFWVYRLFDATLGRRPTFVEFTTQFRRLSGLKPASQRALDEADVLNDFMGLTEFTTIYAGLTNAAQAANFIAKLEQTAGVTLPATATTQPGQPTQYGRQELINLMSAGTLSPAQTLRAFIEQKVVWDKFFNRGFVAMQYFGYLRRDPDTAGFNDWLDILNNGRPSAGIAAGDFRHLVFGFVYSTEYRLRFGPTP